jgi:hypothetical protein
MMTLASRWICTFLLLVCVVTFAEAQDKKAPWTSTSFGLLGGFSYSTFLSKNPYVSGPVTVTNSPYTATQFQVGAFVDFDFVRRAKNQSLRIDVIYFSPHYALNNPDSPQYWVIDINQLKIPVTFKFGFSKGPVVPYVALGLSLTFNLKTYTKLVTNTATGQVVYENNYSPPDLPLGYCLGGGVRIPFSEKITMFFEFRAEKAPDITNLSLSTGIGF